MQRDSPRVAAGRHPLVLVSHGTGGAAASIAWLCQRLAAAGFIAAAVNHHGGTAAERGGLTLPGAVLWWERPADLSRVLDELEADAVLGAHVDFSRVAVAGFSIGAYTALALVGARLTIDRWRPYCAENPGSSLCRVPPEAGFSTDAVWRFLDHEPLALEAFARADLDYRDPRVGAAVAIAPVAVPLMDEDSLRAVGVPICIFGATDDDQSVLDTDVRPLHHLLRDSELTVFDGAGHYTFLSEGTALGHLVARRFVRDRAGIRRRRVHDRVASEIVRFLL